MSLTTVGFGPSVTLATRGLGPSGLLYIYIDGRMIPDVSFISAVFVSSEVNPIASIAEVTPLGEVVYDEDIMGVEQATSGLRITLVESTGAESETNIDVIAMTEFRYTVVRLDGGAVVTVPTTLGAQTTNPFFIALSDLVALDIDEDVTLRFIAKWTYNSLTLGTGAVGRGFFDFKLERLPAEVEGLN